LAAAIYHLREPQKIPQVMSPDETRRLLAVASSSAAANAPTLIRPARPRESGDPAFEFPLARE
jgi:hypothetical protein